MGTVAITGLSCTGLSVFIRWTDPCTTVNRGFPFPVYSDWCECLGTPGPHWFPLNAVMDWAVFCGVSAAGIGVIRRFRRGKPVPPAAGKTTDLPQDL